MQIKANCFITCSHERPCKYAYRSTTSSCLADVIEAIHAKKKERNQSRSFKQSLTPTTFECMNKFMHTSL